MADATHGVQLVPVLALLAAGVIAGPLFKRLGMGSVLGYLMAGVVVGPSSLGVVTDPTTILHVAELGVVLLLFIIGLEMRPARLWSLRRQVFGLGSFQLVACAAVLTCASTLLGFPPVPAFIASAGFALTSTAIVMQLLEERRQTTTLRGQQVVSILLLEDLAIVPLLAAVAALSAATTPNPAVDSSRGVWAIGMAVAAVGGVVVVVRYALHPVFRFLAQVQSRDVMTATALLVVLGAAYVLQASGLSMAMGAFLAGILLADSAFRHQLEADIEPFRDILLGLFFLSVGMSLDLATVVTNWRTILVLVPTYMVGKALTIYLVARATRTPHDDAVDRALVMAQGGEFAFVLFGAAAAGGLVDSGLVATLMAVVVISMVVTPVALWIRKAVARSADTSAGSRPGPRDTGASVLVIGFGRFGQVTSQLLLARGHTISIIDTDVEMIDVARGYGFDVYYGDGTRLDILHAAGVSTARAVLVCVDAVDATTRIVSLIKSEFPTLPVLARAFDRRHGMQLLNVGADAQVRETFESAIVMGERALEALGATTREIVAISSGVRDRDNVRFAREMQGGLEAGRPYFSGKPSASPAEYDHAAGQVLTDASSRPVTGE